MLAKPLAVAADGHGLAFLAGTSPDVGVLGYALGGGTQLDGPKPSASRATRSSRPTWSRQTGAASERPRHRAGPVLGDPRRWRQRRRGDGARARAGPGRRDLCGRAVLADRARDGDPQRVALLDRDGARDVRVPRAPAAAAGRAVPPRTPPRPVVGARRGRDHRFGGRRRGARPAVPRPRPGARHLCPDADERAQPRQHGPRFPAPLLRRRDPARRPAGGGDRRSRPGVRRLAAAPRRGPAPGAAPLHGGRRSTACSTRSTSPSSASRSGSRPTPGPSRRSSTTSRACSGRWVRGTAAGGTSTSPSHAWTRGRSSRRRATTGCGRSRRPTTRTACSAPITRSRSSGRGSGSRLRLAAPARGPGSRPIRAQRAMGWAIHRLPRSARKSKVGGPLASRSAAPDA